MTYDPAEWDVQALTQWADFELPADRDLWPMYLNQMRSDMASAVEQIRELEAALAAARDAA